jgi:streptogramin lyase
MRIRTLWLAVTILSGVQLLFAAPAVADDPPCQAWSVQTLASGQHRLENLEFDGHGGLYLSAHEDSQIRRIDPSGQVSTVISGVNSPGAIRFRLDARTQRQIMYFNTGNSAQSAELGTADGTIERYDRARRIQTTWASGLVAPNGFTFLRDGDAVVSRDLGSGTGITHIPRQPDRYPVEPNWAALDGANGLVVATPGTYLYTVLTFVPNSPVYRIRIADPAQIELVADLGNAKGLDDLTADSKGVLYIAANGSNEIIRVNPTTGNVCVISSLLTGGPMNPTSVRVGRGPGWSQDSVYTTAWDGTVRKLTPP